jgi:ABC-type phosphate transport system ATPase subunit
VHAWARKFAPLNEEAARAFRLPPGRLAEYGPTADIFTRPADERTAANVSGRFG